MFVFSETGDKCNIYDMVDAYAKTLPSSVSCGIVVSPNFPGLVKPALWTWLIDNEAKDEYLSVYLYYVRGPGVAAGVCVNSFESKCN